MYSKKLFFTAFLALAALSAKAQNELEGIKLENVIWSKLCTKVRAYQFIQEGDYCEVVHPASNLNNIQIYSKAKKALRRINMCQHMRDEYIFLTGRSSESVAFCRARFEASLRDRKISPENYKRKTERWIEAHFNEETMR